MALPLALDLTGKLVVVVGGGTVGTRRATRLLDEGALIRLIAPHLTPDLAALAQTAAVEWLPREYAGPIDLVGAWLVHTATGDRATDSAVAADAAAARIWCIDATSADTTAAALLAHTSVSTPDGQITLATHASGDPRLATEIRDALGGALTQGELPLRRHRPRTSGWVALVGGGPGDAGLLTTRARQLLAAADVVVVDRLAPRGVLAGLAEGVHVVDVGKAPGAHAATQDEICTLLIEHARAGKAVVRLKGGDPYVFGRGGEERLACEAAGIPVEVVPGVTSALAVPAAAGIPITHRGIARGFSVVSGHDALPALPPDGDHTVVLLMGVAGLPRSVETLLASGRAPDCPVAIIERGCTPQQRATFATLANVVQVAEAAQVRNPAVIVVGDVVRLSREWPGSRADRNGLDGAGLDGAGFDGAGFEGAGTDEAAVDEGGSTVVPSDALATASLVLAAHGTADPAGTAVLEEIRDALAQRVGVLADDIGLGYVDVTTPTLSDVLTDRPDALVVPLFLAHGHHVDVDVPEAAAEAAARVTDHLGADAALAPALLARALEADPAPRALALLGAGSSRRAAREELQATAAALSRLAGVPVHVGFLSGPGPGAEEALQACLDDADGPAGVVAVPALLAPGHFSRRAARLARDHGVSLAPVLGAHPLVLDIIVRLLRTALDTPDGCAEEQPTEPDVGQVLPHVVVGVSHRELDSTELGVLTAAAADIGQRLTRAQVPGVDGHVLVATCNRFEIYLDAPSFEAGVETALAAITAAVPGRADLLDALRVTTGDGVAAHLFAVASGLDSMVLGEAQVAGQVRTALSGEHSAPSPGLRRLFQAALHAAKAVATHTELGAAGRSLASEGLRLIEERHFALVGRRALVVGTGAYAGIVVAALARRGVSDLEVYSRSGRAPGFAATHPGVAAVPGDGLADALSRADVLVLCGRPGERLGEASALASARMTAPNTLPVLDLTASGGLDPLCRSLPGIDVIGLDEIGLAANGQVATGLAATVPAGSAPAGIAPAGIAPAGTGPAGIAPAGPVTTAQAQLDAAVQAARTLVEEGLSAYLRGELERTAAPAVSAMRSHVGRIIASEQESTLRRHAPDTAQAVAESLHRVSGALLHAPSVRAAESARHGELSDYLRALHTLFGIVVARP